MSGAIISGSGSEGGLDQNDINEFQVTTPDFKEVIETEDDAATGDVYIPVTSISLSDTKATVEMGSTKTLTVTFTPSDATGNPVEWTSSNEEVATVDANGVVTPVAKGTATITATSRGKSATCAVTVTAPAVSEIQLSSEDALSLKVGKTATLPTVTILPALAPQDFTWTASPTGIVEITKAEDGTYSIMGLKASATPVTLTVSAESVSKSITVTVTDIAVTDITLNKTTATIKVGSTETLTPTLTGENGETPTIQTVTWASSDEAVATVDDKGVVTGKKAGTATITATAVGGTGKTATVTITVENELVTSITLKADKEGPLKAGESVTFTAQFEPTKATIKEIKEWGIGETTLATGTVNEDGTYTVKLNETIAADKLTETITVTATPADGSAAEGVTGTATITLAATPISKITLEPATAQELKDGETVTVKATVEPTNATYPTVAFTLNGSTISAKAAEDGAETPANTVTYVAGATLGKTTVTVAPATAVTGDCAAVTLDVTVVETPAESVTITAAENATSMEGGKTLQLTATVAPATVTDGSVTWDVDNADLASITDAGVLTAKEGVKGDVTITATSKSTPTVSGTYKVKIVGVPVTDMTLNGAPTEAMKAGQTVQLSITDITPENATDKTITWTSSDEEIATVDGNGLVTIQDFPAAKLSDKVTITAHANGSTSEAPVNKTCEITLAKTDATGVSAITGAEPGVKLQQGQSIDLSASVEPATATNKVLTWTATIDGQTATGVEITPKGDSVTVKVTEVTTETMNKTVTITAASDNASAPTSTFTFTLAPTPATEMEVTTTIKGEKLEGETTEETSETVDVKSIDFVVGTTETMAITVAVGPETATDKSFTATLSDDIKDKVTVETTGNTVNVKLANGVTEAVNGTLTIAAVNGTAKAEVPVSVAADLTIDNNVKPGSSEMPKIAKTRFIRFWAKTTLAVIWKIIAYTEPAVRADEPAAELSPDQIAKVVATGFDVDKGQAYCDVEAIAPGIVTVQASLAAGEGEEDKVIATQNFEVVNVLVKEIAMDPEVLNMSIGVTETITVTLVSDSETGEKASLPELTWNVSDDKIVKMGKPVMTDKDGIVTWTVEVKALANGNCTITATTTDGTDLSAECTIKVAKTITGIDVVGVDADATMRVYDMSGKCVATSAEEYDRLDEGFYIIKTATSTVKVLKK
ncbi:MAG: Ig-like domain-containing protein [Pseudoflavonifractor sp.]|nr:Ig-like domain-containing protein [Alloprevotella sp.]MCM1117729.1 Ig-like domain-containing protein [Pseudoflavonifractor sp.]